MVTGIDLVEWQLRVAQGEPLPATQEDINQEGHAIEVRIYAEDPLKGFLPSIGKIRIWNHVDMPGARLDSGVDKGSQVTIYYDPQLAKLIIHEPTRRAAIDRLAHYLADFQIEGVTTNVGFLFWITQHPEFREGLTDTSFIDRHWHPQELKLGQYLPPEVALAAAARELIPDPQPYTANPWQYELSPLVAQDVVLTFEYVPPGYVPEHGKAREVRVVARRHSESPHTWDIQTDAFAKQVIVEEADGWRLQISTPTAGGLQKIPIPALNWSGYYDGRLMLVEWEDHLYRLLLPRPLSTDTLAVAVRLPGENHLQAPMPGKIILVPVQEGQEVTEGERLVVMEAMKMEFTLRAPHAGRVARLPVREGQLVDAGTVLVEIA
jgi:3-methylcrotonyl-CoA carboxylase alpha subunit